jgi:hypothetical protein
MKSAFRFKQYFFSQTKIKKLKYVLKKLLNLVLAIFSTKDIVPGFVSLFNLKLCLDSYRSFLTAEWDNAVPLNVYPFRLKGKTLLHIWHFH